MYFLLLRTIAIIWSRLGFDPARSMSLIHSTTLVFEVKGLVSTELLLDFSRLLAVLVTVLVSDNFVDSKEVLHW
jgi:hypothetical protein